MPRRSSFFAFLPFVFLSLLAFGAATATGVCVAIALGIEAAIGGWRRRAFPKSSHKPPNP